jgi:fibronectin type 3 domain-containing protein
MSSVTKANGAFTAEPLTEARLHRVRAELRKPAALGALISLALFGTGLIFITVASAVSTAPGAAGPVCGSPPTGSAVITSARIAGVSTSGTNLSSTGAVEGSPLSTEASALPQATIASVVLSVVASAGNTQVVVSWAVPASDGGSPITGYNVYRGTSPAGESTTPIATNVSPTSFTDTGLTDGTTYYYTVTAVNAIGESPQSAEASATPLAAAPSAPTGLVATAGNQQVALTWVAPASDGGSLITGYNVYRGTSVNGESSTPVASNVSGTSLTDTSVTNGTTYYYKVAAVNSAGTSPSSLEASATPVTVPSAPQALTTINGNGVATLSWNPPASTGGAALTGYDVYRGTTSGGEAATPIATNVSGTSFTDTGLSNGTTYYYTVAAINAVGTSAHSAEASAMPRVLQLCVLVQTYPSSTTTVTAGSTASFVVWVWSTGADSSNVSVAASLSSASFLGAPSFAICPSASGATCTIASLPVGQVYELLASVPVSAAAPVATPVAFTAQASASGALSFSASATEVVAAASTAAPLPSSSSAVPPLLSLPPIPGTGVSAINPSELFPTVSPTGSGTVSLPGARSRSGVHATVVSSAVPIDTRLIGAQLIGLAVLAGAVTIAIMRLSLRRRTATPTPEAAPSADAEQQD